MIRDTLRQLVAFNSIFPNERKLALYAETVLKKNGFKVRRQMIGRNRYNLLAERGEKGKAILFYGHMDTVPVYGKWSTNPFRLTKKGDRLYGLGAIDMKGGLAAILEATKRQTGRRIKILLCSDEECISTGAWKAVKERRNWFSDVAFCISGEPGASKSSIGGSNVVTLGRRGRVVISIDICGVSSHGANPKTGVNAIDEAAKIVRALNSFKLLKHKNLGSESIFARRIESGSTTLSVPEKAHIEVDMHMVPPTSTEMARDRFKKFIAVLAKRGAIDKCTRVTVSVKERETPYIEPFVDSINDTHVKRVVSAVRKHVGKPCINYGSSVSDDNVLANALDVPVMIIGPRGGNMHASNEWVSEKDMAKLAELYSAIISG